MFSHLSRFLVLVDSFPNLPHSKHILLSFILSLRMNSSFITSRPEINRGNLTIEIV